MTREGWQVAAHHEDSNKSSAPTTLSGSPGESDHELLQTCNGTAASGSANTSVHDRISIVSAAERDQVLYEWNQTSAAYPADRCVHQLFEEQVRRSPEATAVVMGERRLSYGELNRRANRLAHWLREQGAGPDGRVAICMERSLEMIEAVLGVVKAGAAYVPLDPAYPDERLRFMVEDSSPAMLLTQPGLEQRFSGLAVPVAELAGQAAPWQNCPDEDLACTGIGLWPSHLAYVIYTSGSTGTPKGVMVPHSGLSNLIHWHCETFHLNSGCCSSSVAGFGFDAATWEIWPPLCAGAMLALCPAKSSDVEELLCWWERQPLDISFLPTPIAEYAFLRGRFPATLRTLLVGGDRLRRPPRAALPFAVINNYGPTEITVVATYGKVQPGQASLSIGRPIGNTRVYILDGSREPVPVGVEGEIYVGGAGVTRGYLNRPEQTAKSFLPDPFAGEGRMYRTGDLGRWLADGDIEFLGRNDFQVKIRGFRIELGEIESRLAEYTGLQDAVVIAREDSPGDKRLVAYYTTAGGGEIPAQELRGHAAATLPEHMVPAAYVHLASMPLTPNGKLDRRALPAPRGTSFAQDDYEPPQTETEKLLAEIWCEVLAVDRIGRHDNFFALGGHSLKAARLLSRVNARFKTDLRLTAIYKSPTIAEFSRSVTNSEPPEQVQRLFPIVLPIRESGTMDPLFCIHPAGGIGSLYAALQTTLDPDCPIYAIQARGLDPHEPRATSIDEMADDYTEIILQMHPAGSYRLLGWSLGGVIAHAVAARLQQRTGRVTLLALLDSVAPGQKQQVLSDAWITSVFARFFMPMNRVWRMSLHLISLLSRTFWISAIRIQLASK